MATSGKENLMLTPTLAFVIAANLAPNPGFEVAGPTGNAPLATKLTGSAIWAYTGYADEISTPGIALDAAKKGSQGAVSQMVRLDPSQGRWVRFSFRGLAEANFAVDKDQVGMSITFFSKGGRNQLERAERLIYRQVLRDRKDLDINGIEGKDGAAVWRTYEFEELLPFQEVDAVQVEVHFRNGHARGAKRTSFFVDDFAVTQSAKSAFGKREPRAKSADTSATSTEGMVALGGRWYYMPRPGEKVTTSGLKVDADNANRLFYKDDRLSNPFARNMSSFLHPGYLDINGNMVKEDKFVKDSLVLTFTGNSLTVRSKNLPNHPTAKFPDTIGTQFYNPGYIQEQDNVWTVPLTPTLNPNAKYMQGRNDGSLPMGPVGFAVNGVVFFNPFDANSTEAVNIMDRCCGHPTPNNLYHYHKYPICVNTPFADKGEGHSPLIGFAFDGIPVYGPYESSGLMARDLSVNKLDGFNAHSDAVRGLHYHVTPGKFPYIIGGFKGVATMRGPRR
ncbi:MAG: YHYH protein [Fimbriimonas sp.]